jgi:uncharacterized RDD family membrane protein YckC
MQQSDVIGRRIGAGVIDLGVAIVILLLVGGIFGNDVGPNASFSSRFGALDKLLAIVLILGYYWGTEAFWGGQTLGKRALGIRVERVDGTRAGPGAILVRTVLRAIDALPILYLIGVIAVFATGPRRQRLGDMAAKTRVVAADAPIDDIPDAPPPPPSNEDVLAQILR